MCITICGRTSSTLQKSAQCYNIPQIFDKKRPCGGIHKENTMELKLENGRPADTTGRLEKRYVLMIFLMHFRCLIRGLTMKL